jgi:hypothetical protein
VRNLLVLVVLAATAATAASAGTPTQFDNSSSCVTNPWFPLRPGKTYVYRGS